jgi:hypothetical protein
MTDDTDQDYTEDYQAWYAEDNPGAQLLNELHAAFGKYVIFPSPEAHDAAVLWCAATHAQPAWEHAPRLTPISPAKRCGKSRLMDVAEAVCHNVLITVNASPAAVVRSITEDNPPTLMVDEADTIFGSKRAAENHEDVRGILNAGHQRNRPYVRWDVLTRSREKCPTFAMAMLAAIGELPDTIMDRAIVIRMRRRGPTEKVAPFRTRRDRPALRALGKRLREWMRANFDTLTTATPELPVEDREADTWEPLIAVADLAGGNWPERARRACLAMTGDEPDDAASGTRLLADLKEIWDAERDPSRGIYAEYLFTKTILQRLRDMDESPWSEWGRKNEPITARGLATLLRPYGVRSQSVRIGEQTSKGYARADLTDPWTRYVTSGTTEQNDDKPGSTSEDERSTDVPLGFSENGTRPTKGERSLYGPDVPFSDSSSGTWPGLQQQPNSSVVPDVPPPVPNTDDPPGSQSDVANNPDLDDPWAVGQLATPITNEDERDDT